MFGTHCHVFDEDKFITKIYYPEDISWDVRFADVMDVDAKGRNYVNFSNFNSLTKTYPVVQGMSENSMKPAYDKERTEIHIIAGGARSSYADALDNGTPRAPIEAVCMFSAKVILVAAEAGLKFRTHLIDMFDKPDWLQSVSPKLETPCTILPGDNEDWTDSSAGVIETMAQRYPEVEKIVSLPAACDPTSLSSMWSIWGALTEAIGLTGNKALIVGNDKDVEKCAQLIRDAIMTFDTCLGDNDFMCGSQPGLTDFQFAPLLEFVASSLETLIAEKAGIDLQHLAPRVLHYRSRMKARASWKASFGGSGSSGGAAMVRYIVAKSMKFSTLENNKKRALYKEMLDRARLIHSAAITESFNSSVMVQSSIAVDQRNVSGEESEATDVKLCV